MELVANQKVETLSTFENRKTREPIKLLKLCHVTQTNMISFKQTNANRNNSYNKPFTIRIGQIFICSLKTTLLIKIKHYLQKNSQLIRRKKTQDNG